MRTAEHLNTVQLDSEQCKGCNLCINVCPNALFEEAGVHTEANAQGFLPVQMQWPEYCINCMHCVDICPDDAFIVPAFPQKNIKGYVFGLSLRFHKFWNGQSTNP